MLATLLLSRAALAVETAPEERRAFLTLVVNEVAGEPILVTLSGQDVRVRRADLEAAGLHFPPELTEDVICLCDRAEVLGWRVDEPAIELEVTVRPAALTATRAELAETTSAPLLYAKQASAYLSYAVQSSDFSSATLAAQAGVSARGLLLTSNLTDILGEWPVRGNTTLSAELHKARLQLNAGDVYATSDKLGGAAAVGGIQLVSATTAQGGPSYDLQDVAEVATPSTLEVYVNGQLKTRQDVAPGPLDIDNIPLQTGLSDTRIVLRDAYGKEQELSFNRYGVANALLPGQHEYSYSVGWVRQNAATESWSYAEPVGFAAHRVGLGPGFTLGARAEGTVDRVSGGVSAVFGVGLGQVELIGAASVGEGRGAAAQGAWAFQGGPVSLGLGASWMSDGYERVGLDVDEDREHLGAEASIGVRPFDALSLTTAYRYRAWRDDAPQKTATVRVEPGLGRVVRAALSGSWSRTDDVDSYAVGLSLSRIFGARLSASVDLEGTPTESTLSPTARGDVAYALPAGPGVGARLGGLWSASPSATAAFVAQSAFGRADVNAAYSASGLSGGLGISGGVVLLGGGVFATRAVDQGYALVDLDGAANIPTTVNGNPVGRTNRNGRLLVTGLLPDYANRIGIEATALPVQFQLLHDTTTATPERQGGAVVDTLVKRARWVRGRLVPTDGGDATYGEASVDVAASMVGKGGRFEFTTLGVGSWRGTARYPGGTCTFTLRIPDTAAAELELGDVPCAP